MKKTLIVIPLLLALVLSGCGVRQMEEPIPSSVPHTAEDMFTTPTDLPTKPAQDTGSYVSIVSDVQKDESGYYLAYEGGEMHLLLRMRFDDLTNRDIGIHLYVDGQPQPYCTEEQPEIGYMHTFPSGNGQEFTLDLCFTPVTGHSGDMLEIGFMVVANPDYFPDGGIGMEEITMMDHSSMGMTIRVKFLADPPDGAIPNIPDRVSAHTAEYIGLTAAEAEMFSSGEYLKEVEYTISVNGQLGYGNLFSITKDDALDVAFELKGSAAAEFGLVLYLDHKPVSHIDEELIFIRTQSGKRVAIRAQIDLTGVDGEGIFYAVLMPRNYRIDQLGGSCLPIVLGPWYLSGSEPPESIA